MQLLPVATTDDGDHSKPTANTHPGRREIDCYMQESVGQLFTYGIKFLQSEFYKKV